MASLAASTMKLLLRMRVKQSDPKSKADLVRHLRSAMNMPMPSRIPQGVAVIKEAIAGVPGEWVTVKNPVMTVLYLHGGAFVGGKLSTYHTFCGQLAQRLNARIFLPDYRLAPEHPYPAATDDAFNVYRQLSADMKGGEPLVVAGDSAGGNLTLVTLLRARDEDYPMPVCALALSPGTDATGTLPSLSANSDSDAMLSKGMVDMAVEVYLAGADPAHPYASPSRGDFAGLPPLLVTVSEEECLRDDAYRVVYNARQAKVPVELLSRPDMPHVWVVFPLFLPEAREDMHTLVRFVEKHAANWALQKQLDVPVVRARVKGKSNPKAKPSTQADSAVH